MTLLLEDLIAETAASDERLAGLSEELRVLDAGKREPSDLPRLRGMVADALPLASAILAMRMALLERLWRSALDSLRKNRGPEADERTLRNLQHVVGFGDQLFRAVRSIQERAVQFGETLDDPEELDRAERRYREVGEDIATALDHREKGWRPRDRERFEEALKQSGEGGAFVKAEDAVAWLRKHREQEEPGAVQR